MIETMLKYLNHASILRCVHGGQAQFVTPPQRSFFNANSPILTDGDLLRAVIVGCPQTGIGLKPCTKITSILMGKARRICVDGETPLLETLQAMTDGSPPGLCAMVSNPSSNAEIGSVFKISPQMRAMLEAHRRGTPFCEICGGG